MNKSSEVLAVLMLSPLFTATAMAQNDPKSEIPLDLGFWVGAGVGIVRFDSNLTLFDEDSGIGGIVDLEGSLGLDEEKAIPFVMGGYGFSEKHSLDFSYFRFNRDSTLIAIDEDFGPIEVNGNATLTDETSFGYLNYGYTLYRDPRAVVKFRAGLYLVDLDLQLNATGDISIDSQPIVDGKYNAGVSQAAPLPLLGLDIWFAITPKWSVGTSVGAVGGSFDEIKATIFDASIMARYAMTEHFGLNIGAVYFGADIELDDDSSLTDVRYGYEGLYLGVDYDF